MQVDIKDIFKGDFLSRKIEGFPYPERYCRFCERELTFIDAIHISGQEHIYKCLYICYNPECGAYDEEARKAYCRVYYSSDEALELLETHRMMVQGVPRKD